MSAHTGFSFHGGDTLLHRLDVRIKLLALAAVGMVSLHAGPVGIALLLLSLWALSRRFSLSLKSVDRELRFFLLLLGVVLLSRALFTPGRILWSAGPLAFTIEGIRDGLLVCSRLTAVVWCGWLFVASTAPGALRTAVHGLFRPIPGIPHQRLSTMIMLTIRLLPLVLDEARATADAQRARGVENRKNPLYRMVRLAVPMLRRSFRRADQLAEAMEARGYTENRRVAIPALTLADAAAAVAVAVFCLTVMLLGS
jgi:energy-coupling factor transporter transmembrane protein EcfT